MESETIAEVVVKLKRVGPTAFNEKCGLRLYFSPRCYADNPYWGFIVRLLKDDWSISYSETRKIVRALRAALKQDERIKKRGTQQPTTGEDGSNRRGGVD